MERTQLRIRALARLMVYSAAVAVTGLTLVACGSGADAGGFLSLGRRDIASAEVISKNNEELTVAVRYMSFRESSGGAIVDEATVKGMMGKISDVWSQCNISFVLEAYEVLDPSGIGAKMSPNSFYDIDTLRTKLQTDSDLLMVATGPWGRDGDLGNPNCYSSFPGDEADGIVCEQKVTGNGNLLAHEVGHWLDLVHTSTGGTNLMSPVISPANSEISADQCATARTAIANSRTKTIVDN